MRRIVYSEYHFSGKERFLYLLEGIGLIGIFAFVFYKSIIAFLLFLPFLYFFIREKKKDLGVQRRRELNLQFREGILAVSAALGAGYSIENAFVAAASDVEVIYGKSGFIVKEFRLLERRLRTNETLESILEDFAERSGLQDVRDFTDVFVIAKRSGGDLNGIIRKASNAISSKIEVKREIDTLMSAKKMEQKIMNAVPFLIILYIEFSSPGFLGVLYHNALGIGVMTICLIIYLVSYFIAKRIVGIEV